MLGNDLQVVPGSFAAPLHLDQIVLQLVKVHLRKAGQMYSYKSSVFTIKKKQKKTKKTRHAFLCAIATSLLYTNTHIQALLLAVFLFICMLLLRPSEVVFYCE